MEIAVEMLAASNRKNFWTKGDVVRSFLKDNPFKQKELADLEELDRRVQQEQLEMSIDGVFAHVHRDRELKRLRQVAARVMQDWKEEQFGLHRRFGAFLARETSAKSEWRWFEIRYCQTSFLQAWRDMKEDHKTRVGITIEETDIILGLARANHAQTVNKVWRDAMVAISDRRSRGEAA